jgi:LysR family glycine cleavage system transcriptional activator
MTVSPPRPKGPPLNALRAFEAAARLGGFAKAAEELSVTPGAVAQHIKALEAWAGADLFERRSQGVQLTLLGASVAEHFADAFDRLGGAVQAMRSEAAPGQIHIAALPSVAQLWLSPKLPAIRAAAPEVTISVTALEHRPNMLREPFDLCIFFEEGPLKPGRSEIGEDVIFPVCAPSLLPSLQSPADLKTVPCLYDSTWSDDWPVWLEDALPGERLDTSGPAFSLYSLAVEEARNGAGVLMGHELLLRPHLDAGDLVAPFERRVVLDRRLTIAVAPSTSANAMLDQITDALVSGHGAAGRDSASAWEDSGHFQV